MNRAIPAPLRPIPPYTRRLRRSRSTPRLFTHRTQNHKASVSPNARAQQPLQRFPLLARSLLTLAKFHRRLTSTPPRLLLPQAQLSTTWRKVLKEPRAGVKLVVHLLACKAGQPTPSRQKTRSPSATSKSRFSSTCASRLSRDLSRLSSSKSKVLFSCRSRLMA